MEFQSVREKLSKLEMHLSEAHAEKKVQHEQFDHVMKMIHVAGGMIPEKAEVAC
jgi:hypothetical protein